MAREILFKAKRINNGKWVEGYYQKRYDEMERERHYIFWCKSNIVWEYAEIDPDTICQYTGLTDKNDNKIWENDIVKKHFYTDYDACVNSEEYIGFVQFECFAWVVKSPKEKLIRTYPIIEAMAYSEDVKHFEVIGNIFDNPELLN